MNEINEKHERHTITINHKAFEKLREKGIFGESYSDVIVRLVDIAGSRKNEI
jgi:predicted CopG family antitoxin